MGGLFVFLKPCSQMGLKHGWNKDFPRPKPPPSSDRWIDTVLIPNGKCHVSLVLFVLFALLFPGFEVFCVVYWNSLFWLLPPPLHIKLALYYIDWTTNVLNCKSLSAGHLKSLQGSTYDYELLCTFFSYSIQIYHCPTSPPYRKSCYVTHQYHWLSASIIFSRQCSHMEISSTLFWMCF